MPPLPIVDAHHHLWDLELKAHPWLVAEPVRGFRYGDYSAIRRSYLPADYRRDTQRFSVVKTVYVEAEWSSADPIGETRWVHAIAAQHGLPNAMVAQAWLDRADVAEVLAEQAAFPLVRSVRHKPKSAARRQEAKRGAPGSMDCARWRAGFALLAGHKLQLRSADALVAPRRRRRACPRFSRHHHHPQPHRPARRPQRRGPCRLAPRV